MMFLCGADDSLLMRKLEFHPFVFSINWCFKAMDCMQENWGKQKSSHFLKMWANHDSAKKWCLFMCIISPFTDVSQEPEKAFGIIYYKCNWKRCYSWNPPQKIMSLPPIKPDLNHIRAPLDAGGIRRAGCCEGAQVHIYTSLLPACVQCITSLSFHQGPQ